MFTISSAAITTTVAQLWKAASATFAQFILTVSTVATVQIEISNKIVCKSVK